MKIKDMLLISLFTALMVVGAFVRIPFPILPITLQPFFCALAGILLGSRLSFISQTIYIALGLIGLPVFANGGGPGYVLQPSFGFILGFAIGAYVIGKLSEIKFPMNIRNALVSLISGLFTIYIIGIPYMYFVLNIYMRKREITIWYTLIANFPYFVKDFILYVAIAIIAVKIVPAIKSSLSNLS